MTLANYTTTVAAVRSANEITKDLVRAGARGIGSEYDPQGRMVSMMFTIVVAGESYVYLLPVRTGAVQAVLIKQRVEKRYQTLDHAERVAWRILRDWVRAQLAIIETEMVALDQVMLPYLQTDNGMTVYDRWTTRRELPAGGNQGD
jgi:hypothetical protein